jgi:hypothetical protein
MGSYVSLDIGRLQVDWGKNFAFANHSCLFLKTDFTKATYYYADDVREVQPAYVRKLGDMIRRLELLGHTMGACRRWYEEMAREAQLESPHVDLSFERFCRAVQSVDLSRSKYDTPPGDAVDEVRIMEWSDLAIALLRRPGCSEIAEALSAVAAVNDMTLLDAISPYAILRILAEDASKLDAEVVWRFEDIVVGGYVSRAELFETLSDEQRQLVVTEGSSDSSILRASLPLVATEVADFFDFVDMKENYPFTGTGNLVNFCKGLAKIRVRNRILVVLDNDTAGREAEQKLRSLALPENIRVLVLPELEEMRRFPTLGPSGSAIEDVNGRAVAIECFLDLRFGAAGTPAVRWTGYNTALNAYQGELVAKDRYVHGFFESHGESGYDLRKLAYLWTEILRACTS